MLLIHETSEFLCTPLLPPHTYYWYEYTQWYGSSKVTACGWFESEPERLLTNSAVHEYRYPYPHETTLLVLRILFKGNLNAGGVYHPAVSIVYCISMLTFFCSRLAKEQTGTQRYILAAAGRARVGVGGEYIPTETPII